MKSNTTTSWVIDRVGEQVIDIDQHGGEHDQVSAFPVLAEKQSNDQRWNSNVQYEVKNSLFLNWNKLSRSRLN